ncbi:uncharacterized protein [Epargyreus clarus]|uniref:uncharacterized protein n=1 Tax=Epargyreus clarus TaxID=520877 RepID=UPI003C2D4EB3
MAWCVFPCSKEARQRLAGVLRALLIAELVLSLVMVIFCYNVSIRVMTLLMHIHKLTVFLLYGLILLQAYCMKLYYTTGLRLITWLIQAPHWPRAAPISKLWMISGIFVAANGFLVQAACRSTLKALVKELSSSLRVGISQYLTEPSWKMLLDTMQIELNCCGAEKPSDWHEIPWLNVDFLNLDSDVVLQLAGADGKVLPPVTPYSCCTPWVLAACYHDPLQQWGSLAAWRLARASLQARGCAEAVRAPLTRAALALRIINALVLLLQLVITALTQLLRSSARDAVLRGDAAGPGRARWRQRRAAPPHGTDHERAESSVCVTARAVSRRRGARARLSCPYLSW